jgi:hypothetical protein
MRRLRINTVECYCDQMGSLNRGMNHGREPQQPQQNQTGKIAKGKAPHWEITQRLLQIPKSSLVRSVYKHPTEQLYSHRKFKDVSFPKTTVA